MASELHFREIGYAADPLGELSEPTFKNLVGSPVTSVALLENGADYPGQYLITVLGGGVTVSVAAEGDDASKNPYTRTPVSVTADGATVNKEVIPGLGIVFPVGPLTPGHQARVCFADFLDPTTGVAARRLNAGIVNAGTPSTARRMLVTNVGADTGAACSVDALPRAWLDGRDAGHSDFIVNLKNHYAELYQKAAVPETKTVTFQNYNGGAVPPTVDVYVENASGGGPILAITAAKLDGTTPYFKGDGIGYHDVNDMLPGQRIILANSPGDPTAETFHIVVFPGYELAQVAPESAPGVPGAYVTPPMTLTGDAPGTPAGEIASADSDIIWARYNPDALQVPGTHRVVRWRLRSQTI